MGRKGTGLFSLSKVMVQRPEEVHSLGEQLPLSLPAPPSPPSSHPLRPKKIRSPPSISVALVSLSKKQQ